MPDLTGRGFRMWPHAVGSNGNGGAGRSTKDDAGDVTRPERSTVEGDNPVLHWCVQGGSGVGVCVPPGVTGW